MSSIDRTDRVGMKRKRGEELLLVCRVCVCVFVLVLFDCFLDAGTGSLSSEHTHVYK